MKPAPILWFTGLSGSGKTTLSRIIAARLSRSGILVESLDGDEVRENLCWDLGFSKSDRNENIRRIGYVSQLLSRNGVVVLVSAISPYRDARDSIREHCPQFVEIYVNSTVEVCEQRDVKGLYAKARRGEITTFTGISDPYEPPYEPEIECRTDCETIEQSADKIMAYLSQHIDIARTCRRCSLNDAGCPMQDGPDCILGDL